MLVKQLQSLLLKRVIKYLAIVICIGFVVYFQNAVLVKLMETRNLTKTSIASITNKLEGLNRKTIDFSDAINTWKILPEDKKSLQGLQINKAKALLDELEKKYKIIGLDLSFSKPIMLSGEDESTSRIYTSNVNISFKAFSDEYVYNFLTELQKRFPGYITIRTFNVSREIEVSKNVIERIAKGEKVPLVSANLEFRWQDLEYVPKNNNGGA